MTTTREHPQWFYDAKLEIALFRDCMPTQAEMAAREQAVMECFDNPILDPAMRRRNSL